jgi:hypothetical protein
VLAVPLRQFGAIRAHVLPLVVGDCSEAHEHCDAEARETNYIPSQPLLHESQASRITFRCIRSERGVGTWTRDRLHPLTTAEPARAAGPTCSCPDHRRVGESVSSARGQPSFRQPRCPRYAGGPANPGHRPFPLLPELPLGAIRAVGERLRGILTVEVHAPAFCRLDPWTRALEAAERGCGDRAFAVLFLHRRGSVVETRAVSNRWRRLSSPCGFGGHCGRIDPAGACALTRSSEVGRPSGAATRGVGPCDDERRSPGRIGGPGLGRYAASSRPALAGSSRSQV